MAKINNAYELFSKTTQSFIYNNQVNATQRMLDFDYVSGRQTPSVAAIVNPTGADTFARFFFGAREILIPVYKTIEKAAKMHPHVDVMVNFASFRSGTSTEEAMAIPQIQTIVIIEVCLRFRTIKARQISWQSHHGPTVGGAGV
jgi:hypothetical protein